MVAGEPAEIRKCISRPCMEHRRIVYNEHKLAVVLGRIHDELPDADGGIGVSQLCVRGGRNCAGDRFDPGRSEVRIKNDRKLLGRYHTGLLVGAIARKFSCSSFLCIPGNDPKSAALHDRNCRGTASHRKSESRWERKARDGGNPDDYPRTGCLARSHKDVRNQWRRIFWRKQRPPIREPYSTDKSRRNAAHIRGSLRSHLHARTHDGFSQAWLGSLECDGRHVSGWSARSL